MVLCSFFTHLSTAYRMNVQILLILDIRVTWRFMWVSQWRHITELYKLSTCKFSQTIAVHLYKIGHTNEESHQIIVGVIYQQANFLININKNN